MTHGILRKTVGLMACAAMVAAMAVPFAGQAQAQEEASAPKNVIVLIADGGGFNQFLVADYYEHGETGRQPYQQGFTSLAMSTYSASAKAPYDPEQAWTSFKYFDKDATDSAAAATAMATGTKTLNGMLGLDPDKQPLPNMHDAAKEAGKSMGVVTSVQLCHATPAGFVARNESRGNYLEIAREMILDSQADVVIGAGHPDFDANGDPVEPESRARKEAERFTLVGGSEVWEGLKAGQIGGDANGDGVRDPWTLVETRAQFVEAAQNPPQRLLGVFQNRGTLQQDRASVSGRPETGAPFETPLLAQMPTMAELTDAALAVLGQNEQGFFLMIEGGAVDWACHGNELNRTIEEMIDFNGAAAVVVAWVEANGGWDENLVVVTADHETGYLTGPDSDPDWNDIVNNGKGEMPGAEYHSGGHTNNLVPFLVRGAGADALVARATKTDSKYGAYLDNTDLANVVRELLGANAPVLAAAE